MVRPPPLQIRSWTQTSKLYQNVQLTTISYENVHVNEEKIKQDSLQHDMQFIHFEIQANI